MMQTITPADHLGVRTANHSQLQSLDDVNLNILMANISNELSANPQKKARNLLTTGEGLKLQPTLLGRKGMNTQD